ncbi:MAG: hypothetical protein ACPGLV_00515 [Bacteroidia bacterium]
MNHFFNLLILSATLSLFLVSCQKEGCTNTYAENYDADATEDDGSCILERDKFLGKYSVSRACVYESDSTYSLEVVEGPNDNEIVLKNLFGWKSNLRATVSGSEIEFVDEYLDITFDGTGYLAGTDLIVSYTVCETFFYPCNDPDECTSTCVKE